jgi:hypothetical protein
MSEPDDMVRLSNRISVVGAFDDIVTEREQEHTIASAKQALEHHAQKEGLVIQSGSVRLTWMLEVRALASPAPKEDSPDLPVDSQDASQ